MLRHRPDEFGLQIDECGFVPFDQVVQAIQERYEDVQETDVVELLEASDQYRFELTERGIRALYGHTFFVEMDGQPMTPPEHLYMGTTQSAARGFKEHGIAPGDRFYVHLSRTRQIAEERSHEEDRPVVVQILAAQASAAGVDFFERGEVLLTLRIPPPFVGEIYGLAAAKEESPDNLWEKPSGQVTYGRKLRKHTRR